MPETKKKTQPLASVAGLAAAAGGWALSRYCLGFFWIPGAAAFLLLLLFTKGPFRPKRFVGAISVTGGHVIWFIVGTAMTRAWAANAADIILVTLGTIWLWFRPGLAAAMVLGILQAAFLSFNAYSLRAAAYGSAAHRALTSHCVFWLISLICLVVGYRR